MKKNKESKKKEIEIKEEENNIKEEKSEINTAETTDDEIDNSKESKSLAELDEQIRDLQDTLLRKVAEFENYKRRTENDQLNLIKYSAESFILKIIPVFDDLGRSVGHLDESNHDSLKEGLKLVYEKFKKILDEQGVKKFEVIGKEFDVEYHEALMQQPSHEVPSNTVLEEVEAGYTYKDKIIKHAKVIVSHEIEAPIEEDSDSQNENEE